MRCSRELYLRARRKDGKTERRNSIYPSNEFDTTDLLACLDFLTTFRTNSRTVYNLDLIATLGAGGVFLNSSSSES